LSHHKKFKIPSLKFLIKHGKENVIRYTLEKIDNDYYDKQILMYVVKYNKYEIINYLLDFISYLTDVLIDAIMKAAKYGNDGIIVTILYEIDDYSDLAENHELIKLCISNDCDNAFDMLLRTGRIDPSQKGGELFIIAAENGKEDVLHWLLNDKRFKLTDDVKDKALTGVVTNSFYDLYEKLKNL